MRSPGVEVQNGDILQSGRSRYLVLDFMGEGDFGKVAKCLNMGTAQDVALKIFKREEHVYTKREINMLEVLSVLDPVKTSVVHFFEKFKHKGQTCLAFEILDRNLYQLLQDRKYKPLSVSEIRPIAQQLLTALQALRKLGVIHSDLKPDNIMLVNQQNEPFRVKLIDFGMSRMTSEVEEGLHLQPLGYRAPEVTLGLSISTAIDMWGLGCVLAFLFLCNHLFGVNCDYQMMRSIVEVLGEPADHLLTAGSFSSRFFNVDPYCDYPQWCLKTPEDFKLATGKVPEKKWKTVRSLDELITIHPKIRGLLEVEDRKSFIILLKGLLQIDPAQRFTPAEASSLPFLTMMHLGKQTGVGTYVDRAFQLVMDRWTFGSGDTNLLTAGVGEEKPEVCGGAEEATAPDGGDTEMMGGATGGGGGEQEEEGEEGGAGWGRSESSDEDARVNVKKKQLHRFFSGVLRNVFRQKK